MYVVKLKILFYIFLVVFSEASPVGKGSCLAIAKWE